MEPPLHSRRSFQHVRHGIQGSRWTQIRTRKSANLQRQRRSNPRTHCVDELFCLDLHQPAFFKCKPGAFKQDVLGDQARMFAADFNTDERVTAGYFMNTINLGNARIQAGLRLEATSASFLANQFNVTKRKFVPGTLVPVPGSQDYIDALPSVQFQYRFGQDTILRLAYGMGIARPNFSDLPPHTSFDPNITPPRPAVSAGNPGLKPTHAQNFDILLERYLKPVGVISGGFFYKYLTDPIFNANSLLTSGQFAGSPQHQPVDGPNTHISH